MVSGKVPLLTERAGGAVPWRTGLRGVLGIAFGSLFLWLAFRNTTYAQVRDLAAAIRPHWIALALALYGADLGLRILRWHALLRELASVSRPLVGEALLVGYAVNNVLPARLGELFRADYVQRRLGLARLKALGSIVIERLLDGITVLLALGLGLVLLHTSAAVERDLESLRRVALIGAILFALIIIGAWTLTRLHAPAWAGARFPRIIQPFRDLRSGIVTLHGGTVFKAVALTAVIWLLESAALWCVVRSLDVALNPAQLLVLTGAATLSTLLPTAPAYLGTYQFAFSLSLAAFGLDSAVGVVAATATQCFLLGSVTALGLGLYLARATRVLARR